MDEASHSVYLIKHHQQSSPTTLLQTKKKYKHLAVPTTILTMLCLTSNKNEVLHIKLNNTKLCYENISPVTNYI